ncbi:GDSL lipase/esterase [Sphaerosporella brunnea]|uniref:GDSL lipase/esterase n=1 Tax=Sphaerosporella brunnea TaxID=1250544 RepID=A0A5J5F3U7_9PEZI|nr:GDSL lipase/esterase [Sphaerosporella brunnea]
MRSFSGTLAVTLTLVGGAAALTLPRSTSSYPGLKGLKYFFSFGDSYTTTGFNITDGSPLPAKGNPLGNPPYPGWTASNGPNWIDYLTVEFNQTETLTFNFAYGGATIDSALVAPYEPQVLSLKQQVEDLFLGVLQPQKATIAPWTAGDSLFLIWIGINDIGSSYLAHPDASDEFHRELMDEYFNLVDELYAVGARNFLFMDVPPVNRSPLTVGQGNQAVSLETEALASYNSLLACRVSDLKKTKSGVWAKVFKSSKVFNTILENPEQYGFKNAITYCSSYQNGTPEWNTFYPECGVPVDQYFWLNSLHPTHNVHKIIAAALANALCV